MKRITLPIGVVAAALLAVASSPTRAATVLFDFENQPIPTEMPFSVTTGGLTATFMGPADVDPGAFAISSNFETATGYQYRLMDGDFLTIGSAFGASGSALRIVFSARVTGFGLDFALDDPSNASVFSFATDAGGSASTGGALTSGFRYPEGSLSYAGPAFTTLTLRSDAIDFQIDNLRLATVAAVPEPASLLLLGAGLPLVALARRWRRHPAGQERQSSAPSVR